MFSALSGFDKNEKRLIGFATSFNNSFKVIIIDSVAEKMVTNFTYYPENCQLFVPQFSPIKNYFKAFIFDLFGFKLEKSQYQNSYEFCEDLRKKFKELQIPTYFMTEENFLCSSLLIAAGVDVSFDEMVLIVMPIGTQKLEENYSNFSTKKNVSFLITELQYTPRGYKLLNQKSVAFDPKMKPAILRQKICGSTIFQKIVISLYKFQKIQFQKIFKSKNVTFLSDGVSDICKNCVVEICKWIFDKSQTKFHILPTCTKSVHVYGEYGTEDNILDILKFNVNDSLPITKKADFSRSIPELVLLFEDKNLKYGRRSQFPKECHRFEVTVKMDEENFEDIQFALLGINNFENVLTKMDALLKPKIPFVGFYDNSSDIGIYKNGGFEFLEEWNGMYGKDCFISFDEKKPKFGKAAQKMLKTKNTFVVFDLLKIMSMPSDDIKINKIWGFTFTKNAENPVLLEFDNFDGTKKAASPAFLMALYLRQHLNAIKVKTGEKPTVIAIWILKEEFNDVEMNRIKDGLKEACKLLKTDAIFVSDELLEVGSDKCKFMDF